MTRGRLNLAVATAAALAISFNASASGTATMQVSAKIIPQGVCVPSVSGVDFGSFSVSDVGYNGFVKEVFVPLSISCNQETIFSVRVDDQNPDKVSGTIGSTEKWQLFGLKNGGGGEGEIRASFLVKLLKDDSDVNESRPFRISADGIRWDVKPDAVYVQGGNRFAYQYKSEPDGAMQPAVSKLGAKYGIQAALYVDKESLSSAKNSVGLSGAATFTIIY